MYDCLPEYQRLGNISHSSQGQESLPGSALENSGEGRLWQVCVTVLRWGVRSLAEAGAVV